MSIQKKIILIYLLFPFLAGYIITTFNIDKTSLLIFLSAIILSSLYFSFKLSIKKIYLQILSVFIPLCVLSVPFWFPINNTMVSREKSKPIYSFSDAKKNPNAFGLWWDFFVSEVMRTNKIIHRDDPLKILPHLLTPDKTINFHEGTIRINNLGLKGNDIPKAKDKAFRIVAIGESTTFGQNVFKDSQPWAGVFQDLILKKLDCNCEVQVLNFGVNAYILKDGIEFLNRNIRWAEPDMVLSYFGWNGVNDLGVDSKFFLTPIPIAQSDLNNISRTQLVFHIIGSKIKSVFNILLNTFILDKVFNFFHDPSQEEKEIFSQIKKSKYYKNYENLIDISKKNNFPLFLISFNTAVTVHDPIEAIQFYQVPFPGVRSTIQLMSYHNKMIEHLSVHHDNVYYIDSSYNILGKYNNDIFLDIVHFTPKGDKQMAENIFKELLPYLMNHPRLKCSLKPNP